MKSKDFKTLSLNQLRGKWLNTIGALLSAFLSLFAVILLVSLPSNIYNILHPHSIAPLPIMLISLLGVIIVYVIEAGFIYGIYKYMLMFVRHGYSECGYIFSGFTSGIKTLVRSFLLMILICIFVYLWALLLIIPGIIAALRYSMAFYILADDDNIKPIDAIRISKKMMYGHKWRLFKLGLSFIGWILLCAVTCGIGFIFLAPYMTAAHSNFYEYLRGIYENKMNTGNL